MRAPKRAVTVQNVKAIRTVADRATDTEDCGHPLKMPGTRRVGDPGCAKRGHEWESLGIMVVEDPHSEDQADAAGR